MNLDKELLNSGELAKLAGVSTDTLRHYERKGVLAGPRGSANGKTDVKRHDERVHQQRNQENDWQCRHR